MLSRRAFAGAILGTVVVAARAADAASYPSRPVRVISPFPAGSASDTVARVVLDKVSQLIGEPMVVEARPGAGGIVGFADVAKADPDGYTLVTSSTSMGTGSALHAQLPYDPNKDFEPIAMFGVQPNVLVASTESGFRPWPTWSRRPRRNPGRSTFVPPESAPPRTWPARSSNSRPTSTSVTFRSRDQGLTEVMAGRIDFYFIPLAAAASALGSGKLNVLAVSSAKRVPLLPDVPSIAEAGYPDAEFSFRLGLSAPANTPREVVDKLHQATETALLDPALQQRLANLGVEPEQMSVEAFAKFVKDDLAATVQLAKAAHIEPVD